MAMIKGKTPNGFRYSIDEGALTDFMFLRALNKSQSKNPSEALDGTMELVSRIFNDEDKERQFYEYEAKLNGGRVPTPVLANELKSIVIRLKEVTQIKKS